jgi:predicted nucleic acid-binding protein
MAIKGLDTTFLIQAEVSKAPGHQNSRAILKETELRGDSLAITPQVLSEFIHIITDPNRFPDAVAMEQAITRAENWWNADIVTQVFPNNQNTLLTLEWLKKYRLGRKRILDTQLAAIYYSAGVKTILTTNSRDFKIFDVFKIESP